jgi:hypothetical protein
LSSVVKSISNTRKRDLNQALSLWFALVVVLLAVLVGAFLGKRQVTNYYLHHDVAFAEAARTESQVDFYDSGALSSQRYSPGRALWQIAMGKLLGLDTQVILQFLPIGSALLAVIYFAFFKRMLGGSVVAALMTLCQMVNPAQLSGVYSIFAYALGTALYLGFVLAFLRVLERRNTAGIFLLFAVAIALNATHYAFTTWIILTAVFMNAGVWAMRRSAQGRQSSHLPEYTLAFVGFAVVIFLAFNEAFYDSYLPHAGDIETLGGGWATFFRRLPWVHAAAEQTLGIAAGAVSSPFGYERSEVLDLLSTANLLVILMPIAFGMPLRLLRIWRSRRDHRDGIGFTLTEVTIWALILTGVVDLLIYSLRGNVGLKYFALVYPVATIWFLRQMGGKRLVALGVGLLLAFSLVRLRVESTVGSIGVRPLSYGQAEAAVTWYHQYWPEPGARVLSGLNLYGKLVVKGASYPYPALHRPGLLIIGPEVYDWLLGRQMSLPLDVARASSILLDVGSDAPLRTAFWRELQPLSWHRAEVEQNPAAVKVYDDGLVWILKP